MNLNEKKKIIHERISCIEDTIIKGREYLEYGKHSDWRGFSPFFHFKRNNGKTLPPHIDWVKNVFLPSQEKALIKAENKLEKLTVKAEKMSKERLQQEAQISIDIDEHF